jgi:hypothetical protein
MISTQNLRVAIAALSASIALVPLPVTAAVSYPSNFHVQQTPYSIGVAAFTDPLWQKGLIRIGFLQRHDAGSQPDIDALLRPVRREKCLHSPRMRSKNCSRNRVAVDERRRVWHGRFRGSGDRHERQRLGSVLFRDDARRGALPSGQRERPVQTAMDFIRSRDR